MIPPTGDDGGPLAVGQTSLVTMFNSAVCFLTMAVAAASGISWLLTFTPWTQFMSANYFVPFFVLMFPLAGWSGFVLHTRRRGNADRRSATDLLNELPRRAWIPIGVIFVTMWLSFVTGAAGLPGQPVYEPASHRYV